MEKPRYTIRDATVADVPAIVSMHAQSWRDTYPHAESGISDEWVKAQTDNWFSDEEMEKRRDIIRRCKGNPNAMYLVAENEQGEIIGFVAPFRNESIQRVGAVYIAKAYQGKGLAQVLMDKIIDWADPHIPLELTVATYNERAKAFYRKYGFEEVSGSQRIVHEKLPIVAMIRKGDMQ